MDVPQNLLGRYLDRRKQDLEACLLALETKDFSRLEKVGHQLKGNGVTFGFTDLSGIGTDLEAAALRRDLAGLERALHRFSGWLRRHVN
jgi:HPt (histidine-containing phosphotransfer) domain-containing protein